MVPVLRPKRRRRLAMSDVSLTPLIDTALTLLIIFMVATPMLHNAIRVTLPRGDVNEAAHVKQELMVEIDKEGTFFFKGKAMKSSDVITQLKSMVANQQHAVVFVKADRESKYGAIMEFVDQVKMVSGIEHVALATEKRRK